MAAGGTLPLGQFPGSPGELRQSDDPDFLAGLNATVTVEFDRQAAGTEIGQHGGLSDRPDRYRPVPGFEEVPCMIELRGAEPTEGGARPGYVTSGRVLFGCAVPADRRFRLIYDDPSRGPIALYLRGRVVDEDEQGHHWFVDVQDQPM